MVLWQSIKFPLILLQAKAVRGEDVSKTLLAASAFPLILLQAKAVSTKIPVGAGDLNMFPLILLQAKAVSFVGPLDTCYFFNLKFPLILLQAKAVS